MSPNRSRFLNLPREIRDAIYQFWVISEVNDPDIEAAQDSMPILDPAIPILPLPSSLSLHLVCRQIHQEVVSELYARFFFWERKFYTHKKNCAPLRRSFTKKAVPGLPLYHRQRVRKLAVPLFIQDYHDHDHKHGGQKRYPVYLESPAQRWPVLEVVLLRVTLGVISTEAQISMATQSILGHIKLVCRYKVVIDFYSSREKDAAAAVAKRIEDESIENVTVVPFEMQRKSET